MSAVGRTRKITKKAARSYEITTPNPLGVTAIASVNRKGSAYARRYKRTRQILESGRGGKGMLRRRKTRRNYSASELFAREPHLSTKSGPDKPRKKRLTAKEKARRAKIAAARRKSSAKQVGRRYGKFHSLVGRVGGQRVSTVAYAGRGGKAKKIPMWALMGAKSKKDFERRVADDPRMARRVVAARKRREKKSERLLLHGDLFTPNRARRRSRKAIPYATWSRSKPMRVRRNTRKKGAAFKKTAQYRKMRAGLKRYLAAKQRGGGGGVARRASRGAHKRVDSRGRRVGKRHTTARTPAQRRATAKMLAARHGRRVHARKTWKNKSVATPNRRRRRAKRNTIVLQPNRKHRRRKARRNTIVLQPNRRHRRRKARRNVISQVAANRRRRRKSRRNPAISQVAANKRRRRRKARRNPVVMQAAANRRRRRKARRNPIYNANRRHGRRRHARRNPIYNANRRHGRRRYRRNPEVMTQLKSAIKVGVKVLIGFIGHRAVSSIVASKGLSQLSVFQAGGSLADYQGLAGGVLTALVGIPLVAKVAPKQAGEIGVGIAVSLLHQALVTVLNKMGQQNIAGYLAAYPDADGKTFHTLRGYGEYETVPGLSGMGAYETVPGLSAYDPYRQYSGFGASPLQQAAAGFGASQLQQAAAGMGEFFMPGATAIGEYEATPDFGPLGAMPHTDEGIHPNLHAAERALTVAEAAAGIGDLPMMATVDAYQVAAPVMDAPGGSRAGILYGSEGIFGQ